MASQIDMIPRYPQRLSREEFFPFAYRFCYLGRKLEISIGELFRKGYTKGTVAQGTGNEATGLVLGMLFRPGQDVLSILHRDILVHLLHGVSIKSLLCQYMANAESISHGREGNVHYGDAAHRRFPMISHLGNMLAPAVGGTWAARRAGENVFGLGVIGDGGTSTGDFHESLNIASVKKVPVLFVIENNEYAFSTPVVNQYRCENLSDRAPGYGIRGATVDGTDSWGMYTAVADALDQMNRDSLPYLLESRTLRLDGHAVYDQAQYVTDDEHRRWSEHDPVARCRNEYMKFCAVQETTVQAMEREIDEEIETAVTEALAVKRPSVLDKPLPVFAQSTTATVEPYRAENLRCFSAVNHALRYVLTREPDSYLLGQDIGPYGSAFKTCKGLFEEFGADRVMDMPIAESGTVGFALGSSQVGARPIMEFQFADFATESTTQLGLNSATWFFRSDSPAPLVFRLPCGGGITLGAFHSGEFEGLWSRFPGLKVLYPATPQEIFEALVAALYDPNPCLVLENKSLYTRTKGDVDFDGNLAALWRSRQWAQGTDVTVVAFGAMLEFAVSAAQQGKISADIWNPFVVSPFDMSPIIESVRRTGRLLVVQESTATAGLGDRIVSLVTRAAFDSLVCAPRIVSAPDMPVPFAPELETYYRPDTARVLEALSQLTGDSRA